MSNLRYTEFPANSQLFTLVLPLGVATRADCPYDLALVIELTVVPHT